MYPLHVAAALVGSALMEGLGNLANRKHEYVLEDDYKQLSKYKLSRYFHLHNV